MLRIAVRRKDGDFVAKILQANGGVHDKALGAANPQVRVEEHDTPALDGHFLRRRRRRGVVELGVRNEGWYVASRADWAGRS